MPPFLEAGNFCPLSKNRIRGRNQLMAIRFFELWRETDANSFAVYLIGGKAHFSAVAEHSVPGVEVELADRRRVAVCVGKAPCAAAQVDLVICYGKEPGSHEGTVRGGRIKVQRLAIVCNPVMLNGDAGEIRACIENLYTDSALQITGSDPQGGGATVDLAEAVKVGENRAADRCAGWSLGKSAQRERRQQKGYAD